MTVNQSEQPQEYDDMLPVSLHQAKSGEYHLLDRHNDEIATFDRAIELEDMQRIVTGINNNAELAAEREKVKELEGIISRIEYVTGDSFPRSTVAKVKK